MGLLLSAVRLITLPFVLVLRWAHHGFSATVDGFVTLLWVIWATLIGGIVLVGFVLYRSGGLGNWIARKIETNLSRRFGIDTKIGTVSVGLTGGVFVVRAHDAIYYNPPGCTGVPYLMKADFMEVAVYVRTLLSPIKVFEIHYYKPHFKYAYGENGKSNVDVVLDHINNMQRPPGGASEKASADASEISHWKWRVLVHRIRWEAGDVTVMPEGRVIPMRNNTVREYGTKKGEQWRPGAAMVLMLQDVKAHVESGTSASLDFDSAPPSHVSND